LSHIWISLWALIDPVAARSTSHRHTQRSKRQLQLSGSLQDSRWQPSWYQLAHGNRDKTLRLCLSTSLAWTWVWYRNRYDWSKGAESPSRPDSAMTQHLSPKRTCLKADQGVKFSYSQVGLLYTEVSWQERPLSTLCEGALLSTSLSVWGGPPHKRPPTSCRFDPNRQIQPPEKTKHLTGTWNKKSHKDVFSWHGGL